MTKWEYLEVSFAHQDFIYKLNTMGQDGWELVSSERGFDSIKMETWVTAIVKRTVDGRKKQLLKD